MLIHYGSYETAFLKQMSERYGGPPEGSAVGNRRFSSAVNLFSVIFAQIYFPTSFKRAERNRGLARISVVRLEPVRHAGDVCRDGSGNDRVISLSKERLVTTTSRTAKRLELVARTIHSLTATTHRTQAGNARRRSQSCMQTLNASRDTMWREFVSPSQEFEVINKAARWDYQRDRIYVAIRQTAIAKSTTTPRRDLQTRTCTALTKWS